MFQTVTEADELPNNLVQFGTGAEPETAAKAAVNSRVHLTLQTAKDTGGRSKAKDSKKDSAAENAPDAAVPVPQRTVTPPITLNIFGGALGKADGTDAGTAPESSDKRGPRKVGDVLAQPQTARGIELPMRPEEQTATNRLAPQASPIQPDPDSAPTVNASAADGSLSKLDPSFEARLQLHEPQESPESSATPRPTKDNAGAPADPAAAAASETAPGVAQTSASNSKHGDGSHHPGQEGSQDPVPSPAGLNAGAEASQNRFDINETAPAASPTAAAHAASRSETPAASQPEPAPEPKPAATAAAAHDIKLELKDGNQRVEVRLTERGGDIHVSVRTPDARLSGAMREELPALTAKLEQSGFRAEAWQPGSTGTAERRAAEAGAEGSSQDSQRHSEQHSQQQKQDNPQQQNSKAPVNTTNRKSDRKDFEWLLQTFR
jgi:hypothetical protein